MQMIGHTRLAPPQSPQDVIETLEVAGPTVRLDNTGWRARAIGREMVD